jgi:hypothetical protein
MMREKSGDIDGVVRALDAIWSICARTERRLGGLVRRREISRGALALELAHLRGLWDAADAVLDRLN